MRPLFALLLLFPIFAHADEPAVKTSYADSLLGEVPKLPAGFDHYPWANPDAPKGGEVSLGGVGTFDNFNPFILRGRAAGVGAIWQTLTEASPDEVTTAYGVLAQTIERPADNSWVAFDLRPEARFSDGTPVTSDDVKWSFDTLREKGRPTYAQDRAMWTMSRRTGQAASCSASRRPATANCTSSAANSLCFRNTGLRDAISPRRLPMRRSAPAHTRSDMSTWAAH